jgi:DNA-binding transcriptional regulator LsrR (DeoR family)
MVHDSDTIATLVQVAQLYYNQNKSQQEIADQLGVSRSLIALYLKQARENNIVRIEIVDPLDRREDLALLLKERTGIRSIHIVPSTVNPELTRRSLGAAVARFLESSLIDGHQVGFGWGRTIMEAANLLAPSNPRQVEIVPLLGESSYTGSYSQMNQIVLQIARSFGGRPHFLLVPLLVGTKELRDSLLADEVASEVTERWKRLDVACVGVGALPPVPGQVLYLGEENVRCYQEDGAVGDVCARYFNIHGKTVENPLNERLIGISLEQLRKVPTVIAVAGGVEKTKALVGAVRSPSLITDLFIDEELGRAVLNELGTQEVVSNGSKG